MASKGRVEAEYSDVRAQAGAYLDQKRQQEKRLKKDLDTAKRQAVRTVANVIALSTILQKGHSLPGEDSDKVAQSVEHFTRGLSQFMNKDGGTYAWAEELESVTASWNKLVLGYKDAIPGSEMSFKDLNIALPEMLNDKVLPAEIYAAKKEAAPA